LFWFFRPRQSSDRWTDEEELSLPSVTRRGPAKPAKNHFSAETEWRTPVPRDASWWNAYAAKKRIKRDGGFEDVSKEDIEIKAPMSVPVSSLNSQGFILRSSAASF
jgi:hypothetical protein